MNRAILVRRAWLSVAVSAVVLGAVIAAGLLSVATPAVTEADARLVVIVHGWSNVAFDVLALTIDAVFGVLGAGLVVLLVLSVSMLRGRRWRSVLALALTIGIPWACAELIKLVVQRPRPDAGLVTPMLVHEPPGTFSYPSGHTAFAVALVCALLLEFAHGPERRRLVAGAAAVVALTAWSRVYLGVHYPTDVIASIVLVPFLAVAVHRLVVLWMPAREPAPREVSRESSR